MRKSIETRKTQNTVNEIFLFNCPSSGGVKDHVEIHNQKRAMRETCDPEIKACLVQLGDIFNWDDFWKTNSGLQSCWANGQFKKSGMEIGLI